MERVEICAWWPELVSLKDELSLRELAERFAITPGAISAALKRTHLTRTTLAARNRSPDPVDARRSRPDAATPTGIARRGAWRLQTADGDRVVVAESLSAAAARADARCANVLALEWIGEVI